MPSVISLKNILVTQGESFCLSIDNLDLAPHRVHALTGPNGAGKSTLLRTMALLIQPQAGTISFAGSDSNDLTQLRQKVTLVEQAPYMFKGSVVDNLSYGLKLRGVQSAERNRRIISTLSVVGLEGFGQREANELSGGEKQRVALARALVLKPELLLLDEPTANIDSDSLQTFEACLTSLSNYGITVVFSTHDLAQSERLGDEVLRIENGRLISES